MNNTLTVIKPSLDVTWHDTTDVSAIKTMLETHMYNERERSIIILFSTWGDPTIKLSMSHMLNFDMGDIGNEEEQIEPRVPGLYCTGGGGEAVAKIAFVGRPEY